MKYKWKGVDMFCGSGGVTTGIEQSGVADVVLAINHDETAIESHTKNHPRTEHITADITDIDLSTISHLRNNIDFIWMSAECTHYSNARGGKPREADSRMLSEQIYRYANFLQPDFIFVENVREFLSWGPLDENGKQIKHLKGTYYKRWIETLKRLGWVNYDYKILNAADYGEATNRKRYFGVFCKPGLSISFPEPTHNQDGSGGLQKWNPCKDLIDTDDHGRSIFGREKPLADGTLKRIAYGLSKYVFTQNELDYIVGYYSSGGNTQSLENPMPTITTGDRHVKIHAEISDFVSQFLTQHIHGANNAVSIENPINTILTKDEKQMITVDRLGLDDLSKVVPLMMQYYGRENSIKDVSDPINAITTINQNALVNVLLEKRQFLTKFYRGPKNNQSLNVPLGTIVTNDKHALTTIDFMAFMIKDIKMRFLRPDELKVLQGFPKDYHLAGSKKKQKWMIGNSVPPKLAKHLVRANFDNHINSIAV